MIKGLLGGGKKGQARNYFAVVTFLFAFGFLNILGYLILDAYVDEFSSTTYYTSEVEDVGNKFLRGLRFLDLVLVLVMVILIIGIGVTSYRVASSPIFFVITFIMAGFYGMVSYFFNYIFAEIVSNTMFTATLKFFPITILICTNLHWIMLINIVVGSITLYAKKEKGQFLS